MLTLYFAPRTRAVRVRWLPVIEDDGVVFCESAAEVMQHARERADIMMGFTLVVARMLGVLDARYPELERYVARLEARPAMHAAAQ